MYLYNKSTNIIDLPTGDILYPGCLSAYINAEDNQLPGMQDIYRSGMVDVLENNNLFAALGYRVYMCYLGDVSMPYDFPDRLLVHDGVVMTVSENVSDINPEKTNTGQSFAAGQTIIWYQGQWVELSLCDVRPDYYHWVAVYDCSGSSWSVILDYVDKIGPETDWVGADYLYTRATLSSSTPSAPAITPACPEQLDIYQPCISGITSDVFEECQTIDLADVYEECDPVPPVEVLADVYEECAV